MTTADLVTRANRRAQRRFRAMVTTHTYANPTDHRTQLYVHAERLLDRLKGEQADFDLAAAHDAGDWRLAAMTGEYVPDVPLALVPECELREMWGGR